MKKKKSQAEAIGIILIVILLSVGLLFMIRFMIQGTTRSVQQTIQYQKSEVAQGIVLTLLRTTTDCKTHEKYSFEDLYKDCARGAFIDCHGGKNSCEFINETIAGILENTLEKWNINEYIFHAYVRNPAGATEDKTNIKKGACLGSREGYEIPIPLFLLNSNIHIFLAICY